MSRGKFIFPLLEPMPGNIRTVFFDFGGTLDSDGTAWRPRFFKIYRKYFPRLAREAYDAAFMDADDNLHLRHNLEKLGFAETVRLQVEDVFANLGLEKKFAGRIAGEFAADSRKHFGESARVLSHLKSKKIKLGVISNFYGNLVSVLESEGLGNFFGYVGDSNAAGCKKPDGKFFTLALEALKSMPEESAMVGDSIVRDIEGARNAGIAARFWIKSPFSGEKPAPGTTVVRTLKEITKFL